MVVNNVLTLILIQIDEVMSEILSIISFFLNMEEISNKTNMNK